VILYLGTEFTRFYYSPFTAFFLGISVFPWIDKPFLLRAWLSRFGASFILLWGLMACGEKNAEVRFGVFPDQGLEPLQAWESFDTLTQDRTLFNPGITKTSWWIGMRISNPTDQEVQRYFVPNNPHINHIQVFENRSGTASLELGDNFPFDQRPFLDRDLVIPLHLPPHSQQEYLIWMDKVGETFHIEPKVYDYQAFQQKKANDTLVIGWILGWMSIIILFALFFAVELKSWTGVIYAAYVCSISLWLATHWGLTFQYFWPDQLIWVGKARPFFNLLTNVLILLLVVRFFPPQTKGKKTAVLIWVTILFQMALLLGVAFVPQVMENVNAKVLLLKVTGVVSLLSSLWVLSYSFQQWRAKVPLAGYYLIGVAFLALFGIILQLNQKILPMGLPSYLVDFGSAFGLMGETGMITAAFARKASLFKKEKEKLVIEMLAKEKQVADQLIQVQEEERKRLGRDLHDSIGGMLASLYIKTETIQAPNQQEALHELRDLIEQSIQEARSLSHNLTPHHLEENGLENVLKAQINLLSQKYSIDFHFFFKVETALPTPLQVMLYRISNELLQNIVKHAQASEALLSISEIDQKIELIAEDNGIGMDPNLSKNGIGLKNIQERVTYLKGNLELESNSSGTTLTISIPLHGSLH
jgi:signal transduction histidine kinase